MKEKLVIIPTYNEKENIENIIRAVFSLQQNFNVLVVDDSSPDGTTQIVQNLQTEFPDKLHLIIRKEKDGLGRAYIHGFKWAIAQNFNYIFEMDADFSHNPNDLPKLYNACLDANAGMSVGSRYVKGINVVNWPLGRILLSYGASKYVQFITRMQVKDPTAGFVCYKKEVLQQLPLDQIKLKGYGFQIEMKFRIHLLGYSINEVSIIFKDRELGQSKINGSIIWEAVFGVIAMKLKSLFTKL